MRILWIGGSHPRHLYYANRLNEAFGLAGAIIEWRENILPEPPEYLSATDRNNWIRHFTNRQNKETAYFDVQHPPQCDTLTVNHERLNSPESVGFVKQIRPDLVLVFGCGMIRDPLASEVPHAVNMHLGLSPRYRGAATLFWPFYFLEPQWAGVTFHYIVSEPDAGQIIHQVRPKLYRDDTIHDIGCRAVLAATEAALQLVECSGIWRTWKQKATGKNFLASDFKAQHLRMIYNVYQDDIVRAYLDGELPGREPKLREQRTNLNRARLFRSNNDG